MNINDPQSPKKSQDPNRNPDERILNPNGKNPSPPLSSPNEPTRAFPSDPAQTYSSDPSQYSQSNKKPGEDDSSKVYSTEPLDTARISQDDKRSYQKDRYQKNQQESFEEKAREAFRNIRDSKKVDDMYSYAVSNKEQTITYILLGIGLLCLLFINNLLGGLIVGMVAGYYYASEIVYYIRHMDQIIRGRDQVRYVVLTALLLGLFIAAPGIFLGAAIMAAFKHVMSGPRDSSPHPQDSDINKSNDR